MGIEEDIKDIKNALINIQPVKSPGLIAEERMVDVEKTLADLQTQISKIDDRVSKIENNLNDIGKAAERLYAVLQRYGIC